MNAMSYELAASHTGLNVALAFIGGLIIVAALVWAVRLGMSVRSREPGPPSPEEQPHLPAEGAVHEIREVREPDEMPHATQESERLMPYGLHPTGTKRSEDQRRHRWSEGSSGSFGGGGPGRT
ncbi:DUF6479 family protein [Streptomyces sp. NPDC008313]|uniref:DUF6479 family protein n=1 Tax=Streptomyces sp. NPDC008313 TaxID=3364826 RepID=UPI0036E66D98